MSIVTFFANVGETFQQKAQDEVMEVKEYNAPTFNAFRNNLEKMKAGEKGLKLNYNLRLPSGHSTPNAVQPDYNEPVAVATTTGYVYPVRYRLAMLFDEGLLRDYKNKQTSAFYDLKRILKNHITAALKRLNRASILDGKGSVAYSTSTLTVLGSNVMNCDTTPAVTAGHTKGGKWMQIETPYHAINETTGLPRGLFTVTLESTTAPTINLLSGSVAAGDPIVDANTYNGWLRGLAWLISKAPRVIQGINTATFSDFNSAGIDLVAAPLTFNAVEDLQTTLQIRNNDKPSRSGKVLFLPPGQGSVLRKSGQNLRVYENNQNVVQGIAQDFETGISTSYIIDADMDEDRVYAAEYNEFGMLEEMPLDVMDLDGSEWHQLMGANNVGSDRFQRSIGWDGNIYRKGNAQSSAYIYRAGTVGVLGQASV